VVFGHISDLSHHPTSHERLILSAKRLFLVK
jgi:hypothetical protein